MKNRLILFMPFLLIVSTAIVFRGVSLLLDYDRAILIGFAFYLVIWCLFIPVRILGWRGFLQLFQKTESLFCKKNLWVAGLLALTAVGAGVMFLNNIRTQPFYVFLIGLPLTILNSTGEEVFWRGLFVSKFRNNFFLSIIYPSVLFTVWHLSPQLADLNKKPADLLFLVLMTLPLGFIYSVAAWKLNSIRWTSIVHSLCGILAFGMPLSTSLITLFK